MTSQIITEGSAIIKTVGKVFYNPVQEFNRDLSISALNAFFKNYTPVTNNSRKDKLVDKSQSTSEQKTFTILEALSATGLRSIRYAKEIKSSVKIVANDLSIQAVEAIKSNVQSNNVEDKITVSHDDAIMLMYKHKNEKFDAIDLDPYGCPSIFLDAAVQAVKDGGLLLITATDMAVLCGNCPETCYSKYGAVSLRIKSCHEMALRILLQCIEAHANRYGRYIEPILSISADFYIRVFVRVFTGPNQCKYTTSKLSMVYHCTGCDSFEFQPLGVVVKRASGQPKFSLPSAPPSSISSKCVHCNGTYHVGGPIWTGPLHSKKFVEQILEVGDQSLGTWKRIIGVLSVVSEELIDAPLYYTLEKLAGTLHCETPPILKIRSAILNAGYRVSYMHANKTSIKTDAPSSDVWDIMRSWIKEHPISDKKLKEGTPAYNILKQSSANEYTFEPHPFANPSSRKQGFVRFQQNPQPHWGPGTRATAMVGEEKICKSKRNQGKRKRDASEESSEDKETQDLIEIEQESNDNR